MTLAPWRSPLQKALHLNRSQAYSRYLQLATVTPEGKPANRTVVFRGFLNNSNSLQIVTDTRSEKFSHLQQTPWAEICWYFTKTREQFRLSGKVCLVTEHHEDSALLQARKILWQNLSEAAKQQFSWPPPGQLRTNDPTLFEPEIDVAIQPSHFCLLLLTPEKVDHLELKGCPHNRSLYHLQDDQQWSIISINP